MTGINPADVAAGVLIAALILGVLLWGFKTTEQPAGRYFAAVWLVMGGALVFWRVSCWTGHMVCG
jgi:hypothetical protein